MENWRIEKVSAVSPTSGSADAAYRVTVVYGEERAEVVVEFAAPSSVASGGYAEQIVRKYLTDDEPPQRLSVARDGSVQIETEPLETVRVPRNRNPPPEPQRGRRRRH